MQLGIQEKLDQAMLVSATAAIELDRIRDECRVGEVESSRIGSSQVDSLAASKDDLEKENRRNQYYVCH